MLQVPLGWRETSLWGGRQDLAPQGTCWPNGTTRAEYLLSKKIPFKKKFSLSSLQISLKMWTGKGWSRYLHLCLQRIDLKKNKRSHTYIKHFTKTTTQEQCLWWEARKKRHMGIRCDAKGCAGLSSLGLGFTPPPASPQHQERISSVKKRKTKQKPHYQNKGVGFVSENVTLRNATEDPNPFQAS